MKADRVRHRERERQIDKKSAERRHTIGNALMRKFSGEFSATDLIAKSNFDGLAF